MAANASWVPAVTPVSSDAPAAADGTEAEAKRPCVAVVDDDRSVGIALCRLLRAADLDAVSFESAQAFLDAIADCAPDCLVLDVQMPGMNGLELQQRLKDVAVDLPVVMITGRDEASIHAICMAMGATAYLRKPLNDEDLLEAVERAIAARRSR